MRLSLGPITYYWPPDILRAFYNQVSDWPVDIVYLGETVCAKRRALSLSDWIAIGEQLAAAGKEVVLSTLSLLEAESDLKTLRHICENGRFLVEANDMAAVNLLSGRVPFITGPSVNLYNPNALRVLRKIGLHRWVLPVELSRESLIAIQADRPAGLEVEIYGYGRLPLAISARCFTARAHNLPKDDCQYRCLDYPEGMVLYSQEEQTFLTLNGVQIQSALTYQLIDAIPDMVKQGIDVVRISPAAQHIEKVVRAFKAVLMGTCSAAHATLEMKTVLGHCTGYWYGRPGIDI